MSEIILHTDGKGLWSGIAKDVRITNMKLGYLYEDGSFGELRVYFDTASWDTRECGLIYTDKKFMRELRKLLNSHGLKGSDVHYSEQGMQGRGYVSCDVGKKFLQSLRTKTDNMEAWTFC